MRHLCSSWAQFFVLNALAAASLVGVTFCANAQEPQTRPSTAEALKRIPADAVALLTIRPSVILHDEAMKLLPLEVMTAAGKEQFGIDPLKVERVDIIVGLPGPDGPQFAALLTFGEDMSVEQLIPQAFSRLLPGAGEMVFYFSDARHLLFGPQAYAERLIKTELADGHLRQLVGKLGEPGQFSAVVALEPMHELLAGLSQMPLIPGPIAPQVANLADKLTMVAIRIDIGSRPMTAVALEAADPSDLEAVEASWKKIVRFGIATAREQYERDLRSDNTPVALAMQAYVQRIAAEIDRQLTLHRNGNRLVMRVDVNQPQMAQTGVLVGLLLPALQAARDAARRAQSANHLRQIVIAAHNYLDAFKRFPGGGRPDPQGKSQLSWRVQLLPFIEQKQLYDEFHHDEPWDSEHNLKLLKRMPDTYRHPQSLAGPGMTVYQMSVGKNLAGEDGRSVKIAEMTDGTSGTIFFVETTDEAAVPWTKPEDINPLESPEKLRKTRGLLQVAFADGSIQNLQADMPPERLKALLTRNQGEMVSP